MSRKVLFIDEWGARLRLRKGLLVLYVRERDQNGKLRLVKKLEVSPVELDSIVFWVRGSSISMAALLEALKHGIDIVVFDNGKPAARVIPATYGSIYKLWIKQLKAYLSREKRLHLARGFAYGKIQNQISNLKYFQKLVKLQDRKLYYTIQESIDNMYMYLQKLNDCKDVDDVRNVEASAARWYWRGVKHLIPKNFGFKKRLKKYDVVPGQEVDPFNKALNIAYGILRKEVWRAIFLVGLNPYVGFLHKPRTGRMSLVFDLMEEFRPAIDRALIATARKTPGKLLALRDPERESEGLVNVAKITFEQLNKIRPEIERQARRVVQYIMQEIPYTPYRLGY